MSEGSQLFGADYCVCYQGGYILSIVVKIKNGEVVFLTLFKCDPYLTPTSSSARTRTIIKQGPTRHRPMAHPMVFRYLSYSTTLKEHAVHRLRRCPAFRLGLFLSVQ